MKICSLLPSSTEIVFALGLGDSLVGVTHECDYPAETATIPSVTSSVVNGESMSGKDIHDAITGLGPRREQHLQPGPGTAGRGKP